MYLGLLLRGTWVKLHLLYSFKISMFSAKKIHFPAVQKRESYKMLLHKAIKLKIVKTHWTSNGVFQYGSVNYMVCYEYWNVCPNRSLSSKKSPFFCYFRNTPQHNTMAQRGLTVSMQLQRPMQPAISVNKWRSVFSCPTCVVCCVSSSGSPMLRAEMPWQSQPCTQRWAHRFPTRPF